VDARKKDADRERERSAEDRAAAIAARTEVVEILAGALFTLLLEGRMPPARDDGEEQLGECS
jgi:hypothetical protein